MYLRASKWVAALAVIAACVACAAAADTDRRPHAGMLRYPDISATQIAFVYGGQLWLVPREGGMAQPVAHPPGDPAFPRFSADGKTLAFIANYDGNNDIYTISVDGGVPKRVTHHPGTEVLNDWTPDGKLLFFGRGYFDLARQSHLMTVSPDGGLPERLPVPYGAVGAISPDGVWLAYTLQAWDHRTWKRYVGGTATDIWLFNLKDKSSKKITDWEGTDSQPMWNGDKIYYMSDGGPEHRLNIWVYDTKTEKREQVTTLKEWDVKWPAIGPGPAGKGEIVFQYGPDLYRLDLATRQAVAVDVRVPGDLARIRPVRVNAAEHISAFELSATGQRAAFEARGDVWSVPAKHGSPRNLTRSSGVAERDPGWSPDGKWIAYFSDRTGEYELYVMRADGKGEARQITGLDPAKDASAQERVFRFAPKWSPDSKYIAFCDKNGRLYVTTFETADTVLVDKDPWASQPQYNWSQDSSKIVYTKRGTNQQSAIWLYDREAKTTAQLTSGMFVDSWPVFDRDGKYLYFATSRYFHGPIYEDVGNSFVYANTDTLVVVPLRKSIASPFAPKSDEETGPPKKDEKKDDKPGDSEKKDQPDKKDKKHGTLVADEDDNDDHDSDGDDDDGDVAHNHIPITDAETKPADAEKKPLVIDVDGFESRAIALPVKPGGFMQLAVNSDGQLVYVRLPRRGSDEKARIMLFDLKEAEEGTAVGEPEDDEAHIRAASDATPAEIDVDAKAEKTVLGGAGGFTLSADGRKLLAAKDGQYYIVDAKPDQKPEKSLAPGGLPTELDPRAEWRQVFTDAWRIERDYFYDPHMHGVDWPAIRKQYEKMLDDCVTRADVGFVISEMIAELNVGHAYYFGNDDPEAPDVNVGMLAADFELANGAYRIASVYQGGPWDTDGRGPLSEPGVKIKTGDYLLAVNGVPLDVAQDPWAAFQGLAGKTVTLTVSDDPKLAPPADSDAKPEDAKDKKADDDKDTPAADDKAKDDPNESAGPPTGQRDVVVKLLTGDQDAAIRYRAWVERNRKYVEDKSGGRVGYLHVPDTGTNGQNELFRQFYGQRAKDALIIDERWNGGGQLPHRFIELLNRPPTNFWAVRESLDSPSPEDAHFGPKCMLINKLAGSGGDMFPYLFRFHKLGKLIGTRTWGGLVGISGNPGCIDGSGITAPTFAFFKLNGTWGIEGWGVDPDIEVMDDPAKMQNGADPQLDRGIEEMLAELKTKPFVPPKRPAYPDRTGMGVRPEDR